MQFGIRMTIRKCERCKLTSDESSKSFWKRFDAGLKDPYICRDCLRANSDGYNFLKNLEKQFPEGIKVLNGRRIPTAVLQRKYKLKFVRAKELPEI